MEPIETICIELTREIITQISNMYAENRQIFIRNIESFYNYRTKLNNTTQNFDYVTSILSDRDVFISFYIAKFVFQLNYNKIISS